MIPWQCWYFKKIINIESRSLILVVFSLKSFTMLKRIFWKPTVLFLNLKNKLLGGYFLLTWKPFMGTNNFFGQPSAMDTFMWAAIFWRYFHFIYQWQYDISIIAIAIIEFISNIATVTNVFCDFFCKFILVACQMDMTMSKIIQAW